ncbi:MAG: Asp/Glu racemase [Pseudomonadota bacterium]|nr:Asp/Glu racemase [Pseudomonadota bacterium]
MTKHYKIGQIVPSSNVTMETEIPAMFRARESILPERFTFHSSRMRMKSVTQEELKKMDAESNRCAYELSDARVDVIGYACLVAIMSMGLGYHRASEEKLGLCTSKNDNPTPIVTSAGALIEGLKALKAKNIALLSPYMKPLAETVVSYIEDEGIQVNDWYTLEIPDNLIVAAQDPENLVTYASELNLDKVDVLVVSACVQMPSLSVIEKIEQAINLPVVSAAVCTTYCMLKSLNLETRVPNAGSLLSGSY